jgi:hypothetical protein
MTGVVVMRAKRCGEGAPEDSHERWRPRGVACAHHADVRVSAVPADRWLAKRNSSTSRATASAR